MAGNIWLATENTNFKQNEKKKEQSWNAKLKLHGHIFIFQASAL